MTETCEYCQRSLSSKSVLTRHQKTSTRCLMIQGKIPKPPDSLSPCTGCGRTFSRKNIRKDHLRTCPLLKLKEDLEKKHLEHCEELEKRHREELGDMKRNHREELGDMKRDHLNTEKSLLDEIRQLQLHNAVITGRLEEQREKVELLNGLCEKSVSAPRNVTNNNITLCDLDVFNPKLLADEVTRKDFFDGAEGLGRRVRDYRQDGKQIFEVVDENRRKFKILEGGQMKRDDNAIILKKIVRDPLRQGVERVSKEVASADHNPENLIKIKKECNAAIAHGHDAKFLKGLTQRNG